LPHKRPTCRPQLEALEDRIVPSGGYHFQTIDDPNGTPSYNAASGINSRGEIVGGYEDASGAFHGYLRSGGRYTTLDDSNAVLGTDALGINARGKIVGEYTDANTAGHGFLLSGGQYTTLDDPNAVGFTFASGINDHGQIVGAYDDASGTEHGFLLSGGQYTTLDDPHAGTGSFVGTRAFGINARGDIVGVYEDASLNEHGFLLSGGQYTTLDDPHAGTGSFVGTFATGINARGDIVGLYFDASGNEHGFLLRHGQYTTLDVPNALLTSAHGINDSGKIVGQYEDRSGGLHGYLATKAHDDDSPAGASPAAGRASGDNADLLLPTAALTNATLTANHVINVAVDSGGNRTDDLSSISADPTWAVATLPSALPGSGDSTGGGVHGVPEAGTDNGLPGNDVLARSDDIFRVDL
jgi:probable HAF family extracellular repeat protein